MTTTIIEVDPIEIKAGDVIVDSRFPVGIEDSLSAFDDAERSSVMLGCVKDCECECFRCSLP